MKKTPIAVILLVLILAAALLVVWGTTEPGLFIPGGRNVEAAQYAHSGEIGEIVELPCLPSFINRKTTR